MKYVPLSRHAKKQSKGCWELGPSKGTVSDPVCCGVVPREAGRTKGSKPGREGLFLKGYPKAITKAEKTTRKKKGPHWLVPNQKPRAIQEKITAMLREEKSTNIRQKHPCINPPEGKG